ncbi:MAG: GDP-mannose-dependent alpha-(1-6)-phosphatidylinositol monomannoside mannosyltransferase [Alphaproteobacteria bacterium MarineAlpha11_Bin1]|nr:MAG: GDP-mannose-dependent alpha-(1-6)-phosphatidylinositol monomannoside mannosyltransferase [Alphaproteobacteria bacterium MarineAlpha11_Bin1]|tara:strand:- start:37462 stop:38715 length:1254 start_codon:yes stop_codon:yes gene_type:complete
MSGRIAIVVKGYPRLSETFIAQEIRGLEERGLDVEIVSLRHPTDSQKHPVHEEIEAPVRYLPEYLYQEPRRVWVAWRKMRKLSAYRKVRRAWLRDLYRDRTTNRIRRFGQALVLAHELAPDIEHIHAHFLHTPASVARYAAALTGRPWTVSAHAKDIWTTPEWEKREKLAAASWLVTCSGYARDHLAALDNGEGKVELVYHGLDADRFPPAPNRRALRDGSDPDDPLYFLCVGRAVEKKGHDILLDAVAGLPSHINWRLWHVGGGELCDRLKVRAERLGIADRVVWFGALPQGEVRNLYRKADLFVLASRVGNDGDRDGLPNVLMEAQSQGLVCVATDVSAIPELIVDGETGVLVPADNPDALRNAIATLAVNSERRLFLGRAGEARVRSAFSFRAGIDRLAAKLGAAVTLSDRDAA